MEHKPGISARAFWDVCIEDLDFEGQKEYIITKVFEYGTWKDMLAITRFYGAELVKQSIVSHRFFFPDTISFISAIFNIPKEQMACSTSRPYRQIVSAYSGN